MDEAIQVSCIIDKLPPSWKDFKNTLKHLKEELTLVELGSQLLIEQSLRMQDSDKPKGNNVVGPSVVSMVEHNNSSRAVVRLRDPKLKTLGERGIECCNISYFQVNILLRGALGAFESRGERGIECIFVGYVEHSKAFRFYVIEPNDSVSINSIIESRDAIFNKNRFSSVPRPSLRIPNGTEDIGGLVVPEEVTEEVVQQPEPELRKSKRNRIPKDFGPEFQLYLIEQTRDEDVAFWKEVINDEMDSIMSNNTWVLADLPPVEHISTIRLLIAMTTIHNQIIRQMDVKIAFLNGDLDEKQAPKQWHQKLDEVVLSNGYLLKQANKCVYSKFDETGKGVIICLYVDDMLIFGTDQVQVNLTKEFLSSRFFMKDMGEANIILGIRIKHESNGIAISQSHYIKKVLKKFNYFDCTPVSTPMDTSEKLMPNNGQVVSQLEYSRVIGCLMCAMTCTRPDIAFVVGKLSRYTSNLGTNDASWINNTKDNSSTSGWVFLFGGGVIFWDSKKQTCITGSTMKYEFVALAVAGKEAECAAMLAKAYIQMYNGKSRHLGVRHSMIRELITNGVISIEFVRSQQNLAHHLTKGLARDLVIKPVKGMRLKELKHMYLHIIPRICLEPTEKEDEVFTS
ncbi:zinc finger, CCHC-type containing protein [Tanacetum coccineum]